VEKEEVNSRQEENEVEFLGSYKDNICISDPTEKKIVVTIQNSSRDRALNSIEAIGNRSSSPSFITACANHVTGRDSNTSKPVLQQKDEPIINGFSMTTFK
jgi:hypothetical protein